MWIVLLLYNIIVFSFSDSLKSSKELNRQKDWSQQASVISSCGGSFNFFTIHWYYSSMLILSHQNLKDYFKHYTSKFLNTVWIVKPVVVMMMLLMTLIIWWWKDARVVESKINKYLPCDFISLKVLITAKVLPPSNQKNTQLSRCTGPVTQASH